MKLKPALIAIALAASAPAPALAQQAMTLQQAFLSADTNGDGAISRAEFEAANAERFNRLDANRDGRIAAGERRTPPPGVNLPADAAAARTRAQVQAGEAQFFQRLDKNNDGFITTDEISRPAQ